MIRRGGIRADFGIIFRSENVTEFDRILAPETASVSDPVLRSENAPGASPGTGDLADPAPISPKSSSSFREARP